MKNTASEFYRNRKPCVQSLYDIQIKSRKRKIHSYKESFLIKKSVEKEQDKNKSRNYLYYSQSSASVNGDRSKYLTNNEISSSLDKINIRKNYSQLYSEYKNILQKMDENNRKIIDNLKPTNTCMTKSRNPTNHLFLHFNTKESSIHGTRSYILIEEHFDQLYLQSTESTVSHLDKTDEENSYKKNHISFKYQEKIEETSQELESPIIKNKNLKKSSLKKFNSRTNKINNIKLKMNSKTSTSTQNLRKSVSKYEQDLEEKEKFKKAVLSKTMTKSTTNLLAKKPNTSLIKNYGIVAKIVSSKKRVTNLSKTQDNKVSQRETTIVNLSENNLEREKIESSHGVITIDLNDTDTMQQENLNNEDLNESERPEEAVYPCELSNICEDPVEKDEPVEEKQSKESNYKAEHEKSASKDPEEIINDSSEEIQKIQTTHLVENQLRNSVILNIQNSFNDLMIKKVNDISLLYENMNVTYKDKNYMNDVSNIVDSQMNFSINNKKEKRFLIASQNGFDIITPKVLSIYHNENSKKSPQVNASKVENLERLVEEQEEKKLDYSNDINMVNEINQNTIECAERKKSFEEDRFKTVDDFLQIEKPDDTVNINQIQFDDLLDKELLCPTNDGVNNQPAKEYHEVLLKNKKFTELLELIDKPAAENERYVQKNIFKSDVKKMNQKKENNRNNFFKSKDDENSKSLMNNIELTRKIICTGEKRSNLNVSDRNLKKKSDLYVQPNESINLNVVNEYYYQMNKNVEHSMISKKPIDKHHLKNKNIELDNKFFDEGLATNFASKYLNIELNKSITNSNSNNKKKHNDLYNEKRESKNPGTNSSRNFTNELKSSCNNLKTSQLRHVQTLETYIEKNNERNPKICKLPGIDISSSHKKEIYVKRNQTEERMFNIMPINDIDLKPIRMNRSNIIHLINI